MRSFKITDFFIVMIILIVSLSFIILLFENQDMFLDEEYLNIRDIVNHSNNETIFLCPNGSYEIITPYDIYICGELNKDIRLKKQSI